MAHGHPRLADGFTRIANELLEALIRYPWRNPSSLPTLLCIVRLTWGYHKISGQVSVSELCRMTGCARSPVKRALAELREAGVITRGIDTEIDGHRAAWTSINKRWVDWHWPRGSKPEVDDRGRIRRGEVVKRNRGHTDYRKLGQATASATARQGPSQGPVRVANLAAEALHRAQARTEPPPDLPRRPPQPEPTPTERVLPEPPSSDPEDLTDAERDMRQRIEAYVRQGYTHVKAMRQVAMDMRGGRPREGTLERAADQPPKLTQPERDALLAEARRRYQRPPVIEGQVVPEGDTGGPSTDPQSDTGGPRTDPQSTNGGPRADPQSG